MKSWLLERVQLEGNPLIDVDRVTFVWVGRTAPQLMADFSDWERGEPVTLSRAGSDLWTHQTSLPEDAYMEYAFFQDEERIPDPHNHHMTPDGLGHHNNYFSMPAAVHTDLIKRRRSVPHGSVERQKVDTYHLAAGKKRTVHLYQPPVSEPCPLLVVWDGREYLRRAKLNLIIDNLVHRERIQPVALAMVENNESARMPEYACSESILAFLMQAVLPLAEERLNLLNVKEYPGSYGVLGASMGGLMALYTAFRLPDIFGRALCQSGGFSFGEYETIIFELAKRGDLRPVKIWMDVGRYDFRFLLESNRKLYPLLVDRGYDVTYREYPGGHNYPAWRDEVWRGLEALFGTGKTNS